MQQKNKLIEKLLRKHEITTSDLLIYLLQKDNKTLTEAKRKLKTESHEREEQKKEALKILKDVEKVFNNGIGVTNAQVLKALKNKYPRLTSHKLGTILLTKYEQSLCKVNGKTSRVYFIS